MEINLKVMKTLGQLKLMKSFIEEGMLSFNSNVMRFQQSFSLQALNFMRMSSRIVTALCTRDAVASILELRL